MIDYTRVDGLTVYVCASAYLSDDAAELQARLALAGASVLTPEPAIGPEEPGPHRPAGFGEVARRRIRQCDLVAVASDDGHIWTEIDDEIAYALRLGIPVHLTSDPLVVAVEPWVYDGLVARTTTMVIDEALARYAETRRGTLLEFTDGNPAGARRAWCRVEEVERLGARADVASAVDADRVRAGLGSHGLLALLEERYPRPDTDWMRFLGLEVVFLGELDPHRERARAVARSVPRFTAGASLLVHDHDGKVLLVPDTDVPGAWRLPGGPLRPGESPGRAAARAASEALGAPVPEPVGLLVLDQLPADSCGEPRSEYVFDGGEVSLVRAQGLIAHAAREGRARFARLSRLEALVAPCSLRQIAHAMKRVSDPAHPVLLEDGYLPTAGSYWHWHPGTELPDAVPVQHAGVWCFDRDGRVLLPYRVDGRPRFGLPGAQPTATDRNVVDSAARGVLEQCGVIIDPDRTIVLGYQTTDKNADFPDGVAHVRLAAPIVGYHPIPAAQDTAGGGMRHAYRRFLTDVRRAGDLLDHGRIGHLQAMAAERAASEFLRIPVERPAADGFRDHGDPHLATSRQVTAQVGDR